jgi:hypothetical protein
MLNLTLNPAITLQRFHALCDNRRFEKSNAMTLFYWRFEMVLERMSCP